MQAELDVASTKTTRALSPTQAQCFELWFCVSTCRQIYSDLLSTKTLVCTKEAYLILSAHSVDNTLIKAHDDPSSPEMTNPCRMSNCVVAKAIIVSWLVIICMGIITSIGYSPPSLLGLTNTLYDCSLKFLMDYWFILFWEKLTR